MSVKIRGDIMKQKLALWTICFGMHVFAVQAEYRAFTDTKGREINAELIRYDATKKKVTIKRKGKGTTTVPISLFSENDQKYIIAWDKDQEFLSDRKLKVEFNRRKRKNTYYSQDAYSMSRKFYDCSYKITFKNGSTADFKKVTLEYVIFYRQDKHINNNLKTEEQQGTLYVKKTITLPKKSETEFETEKLLLYTHRESGYSIDWPDLQSEVHGIILKLSLESETGEPISRQIKSPEKLNHVWTPRTKNVQRRVSN